MPSASTIRPDDAAHAPAHADRRDGLQQRAVALEVQLLRCLHDGVRRHRWPPLRQRWHRASGGDGAVASRAASETLRSPRFQALRFRAPRRLGGPPPDLVATGRPEGCARSPPAGRRAWRRPAPRFGVDDAAPDADGAVRQSPPSWPQASPGRIREAGRSTACPVLRGLTRMRTMFCAPARSQRALHGGEHETRLQRAPDRPGSRPRRRSTSSSMLPLRLLAAGGRAEPSPVA